MKSTNTSRRRFLQKLSAAPLLKFSPLLATAGAHSTAVAAEDYKSLVCVFLAGGADSFNFVVPGGQKYQDYLATRGNMAVLDSENSQYAPGSPFIPASDASQGDFGFNGLLPGLHQMYESGDLAVVCNVGNLVKPTDKDQYTNGTVPLPQSLFAHDAQQKLWQTGSAVVSESTGWGGSLLHQLRQSNSGASATAAISVANSSEWLNTTSQAYMSLNPGEAPSLLAGYDANADTTRPDVQQILADLLDDSTAGKHGQMNASVAQAINGAINTSNALMTSFDQFDVDMDYSSTNSLAAQLETVAKLIAAREELKMGRQVFFVQMGGWDTHSQQNRRLAPLLRDLNEALTTFNGAINAMGKSQSVTTFTASEFGRTLTRNGDGTDHGWGGNAFVMGGAVQGGKIVGDFPEFRTENNPDDADDGSGNFAGRIIPKISVLQYAASLSDWMGLSAAERDTVFPGYTSGGFSTDNLNLFA